MYSSWNAFHYKPLTFNISCSIPSSQRGFSLSLLFNFVVDCVHRSHSNQARLSKDEPTWLERTQLMGCWRLSCIGFTKLLHFHVQALKTFRCPEYQERSHESIFKRFSLSALRASVRLGVNYVAIECNFPLNHSKDRLETVEKLDNEDDKQCQITVEKIRYNIHDTS